jgi:hypothetical protein
MLRGMISIPANHPIRGVDRLNNSLNENIVLHTRNLCDFCTSGRRNDIKPSDLFATTLRIRNIGSLDG